MLDDLLAVLLVALQPERLQEQQHAEAQLKAWETAPGYHFSLQSIYLNTENPLRVRWMAILCFKNGVDRFWRLSRVNAIGKDEKKEIRSRLFNLVEESNNQLSIQNAHAIARIVRFDFPSEWPSLFDDIAHAIEEYVFVKGNLIGVNNLLIFLNQIVKAVALVRIGRARHAMQIKAPVLLPVLVKAYLRYYASWTSTMELPVMEVCYLCLKNLRRLIPEGFELPHREPEIVEFMRLSITHLQHLVMEHEKYSSELLERFVQSYSKLYVNLLHVNPTSFVLMPSAHDVMSTFLLLLESKAEDIYRSEENDFWEALALKGLLILKRMLSFVYKQGAITLKLRTDKEDVHNAVAKLKTSFFTQQVVHNLCDLIINWYLRIKPADLESWLLEPEEWTNEEYNASWEYQLRPCAENFYKDLIKYFRDDLAGFILEKISAGLAGDSLESILTKDSTLCTFQLSAHAIADKVNFDQLLEQVFIPEGLKNDLVENKIIRRRVCLVICSWVGVDCSRESRVAIYKLLISFLQPEKINDKVVMLTAVQTVTAVITDYDFNKHDFQPFLKDFVALSIGLLKDMAYTESKLYIFKTLCVLVERCNPLIDEPTLISILQVVSASWDKEESILKTHLLRLLKNLVVALNGNSDQTHYIAFPLVNACCSENSEYYSLLSEEGFDLWLLLVQYYPVSEPSDKVTGLFGMAEKALVDCTEILPTILSILRSYALLAPQLFHNEPVFKVLAEYLPGMRDDAFEIFVALVDILLLDSDILQPLVSSGLMESMIRYVFDDNQSVVQANKIFVIFSRLAMRPETFFQLLSHLKVDKGAFFGLWLKYYKHNGSPRNKKVNLLALLSLAPNVPVLGPYFCEILRNCFLFLDEVNEEACLYDDDVLYADIDNYAYLDPDIAPHGEKLRYQVLQQQCAVYRMSVRETLLSVCGAVRGTHPAEFAQLTLADAYVAEGLGRLN